MKRWIKRHQWPLRVLVGLEAITAFIWIEAYILGPPLNPDKFDFQMLLLAAAWLAPISVWIIGQEIYDWLRRKELRAFNMFEPPPGCIDFSRFIIARVDGWRPEHLEHIAKCERCSNLDRRYVQSCKSLGEV